MTYLKRNIHSITRFLGVVAFSLFAPALFSFSASKIKKPIVTVHGTAVHVSSAFELYNSLGLDSLGLSKEAFNEAITGYLNLQLRGTIQNDAILSIVDFSQPSFRKRLFILDMENGKLLFNTLVAHGRNSGELLATRFSNRSKSFESSLGFYVTGESYTGQKGYSLRLMGMEQGINSNAFKRGIVVHAASYVNEETSRACGRLGRSEGCPAIPYIVHRSVIEAIKNGTCFFIYGKNLKYQTRSKLLKQSPLS